MKQQTFGPETQTDTHSRNVLHHKESRIGQKSVNIAQSSMQGKYLSLPADQHAQNRLIDECLEWVLKNKPKSINDFPLLKGYCPFRFRNLGKKNPYFAEVLDYTMAIIGRKIEDGWREEDIVSYAKAYLPQYDKNYKEDRDALAAKIGNAIGETKAFVPAVRERSEIEAMERADNGECLPNEIQTTELPGKTNSSSGT